MCGRQSVTRRPTTQLTGAVLLFKGTLPATAARRIDRIVQRYKALVVAVCALFSLTDKPLDQIVPRADRTSRKKGRRSDPIE